MKRSLWSSLVGCSLIGLLALALLPAPAAAQGAAPEGPPKLALNGFDPVELIAGKTVEGKKELSAIAGKFTYRFASAANRKVFQSDPERYGIALDGMCPIFPTTPVDPSIFTVYKGKIYGFATMPCLARFKEKPDAFID